MKLHWVIAALVSFAADASEAAPDSCRCLPGDDCWPSSSDWQSLNETVSGRLIETVPIGSPCHDPTYDGETCEALREQWTKYKTQYVMVYSETWNFLVFFFSFFREARAGLLMYTVTFKHPVSVVHYQPNLCQPEL